MKLLTESLCVRTRNKGAMISTTVKLRGLGRGRGAEPLTGASFPMGLITPLVDGVVLHVARTQRKKTVGLLD